MTVPNLGKRSISASVWFMFGSGGQLVLQFLFFIVLARLLGPRPFGIASIAAIFIDMLALIGRFGVVEALIQKQEFSAKTESTAFWVTAFFGFLTSLLIYLATPLVVAAYELDELGGVLHWLAPTCFFNATCAVYEARLRRELRFKSLAQRNLITAICGSLVAIVMAYLDFGVYSLVAQRIVVVLLFLGILIQQARWLPSFAFDKAEGAAIAKSGLSIVCISLLGVWNQKVIDLIISLVLGPVPLGYLRIACRGPEILQQISLQALMPVAMSSFARLAQEKERFKAAYARVVNGTAMLMYPLYAGLIVLGGDFIEIFFGNKWQNSLVPMQVLSLVGFIGPLFLYNGIAMVAMGRNRLVLFVNAFEFAISAICAAIMARRGLEWAAASSVVRSLIFVPFSLWFAKKELDLPYLGTVVACWRPAVAASLLVLAVVGSRYLAAPFAPKIITAILAGLTGAAVYCVAIWSLEFENLIFIWERSPASRVLKMPFLRRIISYIRQS